MPTSLIVAPPAQPRALEARGRLTPATGTGQAPVWGLRIDEHAVALVLQHAPMPLGGRIAELVVDLPHVSMPFDFSEGVLRFRHHRGVARSATVSLDLQVLLDRLAERTQGLVTGRAVDGAVVFSGHTDEGARFTARARVVADTDRDGASALSDEPALLLSLYDIRVYGRTNTPWSVVAGQVLDALDEDWVIERTLTTARIVVLRQLLSWALSELGWKLPAMADLKLTAAHIQDDRLALRFATPGDDDWLTIDAGAVDPASRETFERFVEDLELKQHHGAIDRALQRGQYRDAMAELYRTLDGPLQPGYLVERLVGICATNPVLYDEGEKVCREVLRVSPGYPAALCGLASIAMGRGLLEEAAVHFERLSTALTAAAERQDAICADLTLAESLRAIDKEEARAALERILKRAPDHEEALDGLLAIAGDSGNEAEALGLCKRLLFAARDTARTRMAGLRLARHALQRDEPSEARVYLEVVLEALPGDLEALMALADVAAHDGDEQAAVHTLEQALRASGSRDDVVLLKVVEVLAKRALAIDPPQPARARRVLWRAVDQSGLDDEAQIRLGRLALRAEAVDLAERFARSVDERSPLWAQGRCLQAEVLLVAQRVGEALNVALRVVEESPEVAEALDLVVEAAQTPADRERALVALSAAVKRVAAGRQHGSVNAALGALYEATGLHWDAIEPLQEAVASLPPVDPHWEAAARRLMHLYARFGMWPEHQALCDVWLSGRDEAADRIPCLLARARVALVEQDDPTFAIPSLEELLELSPRDAEGLTLYRDALERLGAAGERAHKLLGALRRLESVHPDDRERVEARIRLAELQLDALDAPGQARATLGRLPGWAQADPRVALITARIRRDPMAIERAKRSVEAARAEVDDSGAAPSVELPQSAYERALAAADRGDLDGAARWAATWLEDQPLHIPGLELQRIIALDAQDQATAIEATDGLVALTLDKEARVALMAETVSLLPQTMPRYRRVLDKLGWVPPPHVQAREALRQEAEAREAAAQTVAETAAQNVVQASAQRVEETGDQSVLKTVAETVQAAEVSALQANSEREHGDDAAPNALSESGFVDAAPAEPSQPPKPAKPSDPVKPAESDWGETSKASEPPVSLAASPQPLEHEHREPVGDHRGDDVAADLGYLLEASPSLSQVATAPDSRSVDGDLDWGAGMEPAGAAAVVAPEANAQVDSSPRQAERPRDQDDDLSVSEQALPPAAQARLDEAAAIDDAFERAERAHALGRREDALLAVHQVLALDEDHVPALELYALLLESVGGWQPLADTLARLADLSFDAEQTLGYTLERARIYAERLGDPAEAARAWSQYLEWQPLDDVVFERLASYLQEQAAWEDLANLLADRQAAASEALADERDVPVASMLATRLAGASRREAVIRLNRLDDPEGALSAIERGAEVRPGDPELMEVHVRILAALGQRQACRDLLDELLPLLLPGPLKDEMLLLRGL